MFSPTPLLRPGEGATDVFSLFHTSTSASITPMDTSTPPTANPDCLPSRSVTRRRRPIPTSSSTCAPVPHLPLWKQRKLPPPPSNQENFALSPSSFHPSVPLLRPLPSSNSSRPRPALAALPLNRPSSYPAPRKQWSKGSGPGVAVPLIPSPDTSFFQEDDLPLPSPSPTSSPSPSPLLPLNTLPPSSDSVKVRLIESLQAELLSLQHLRHPPPPPSLQPQVDFLTSLVARLQGEVEALTRQVVEGRGVRVALTNQLMDVKGGIRVFCRIRPSTPHPSPLLTVKGGEGKEVVTVRCADGVGVDGRVCPRPPATFAFDRVFPPLPSHPSLHEELLPYFTSSVSGVSATLCLYGQTSSGKSHAMWEEQGGGLIRAALQAIWTEVEAARVAGSTVPVRLSCVELYEEGIVDLLSPTPTPGDCISLPAVPVDGCGGCMDLLHGARARRTLGCTRLNATSSRGHTLIRLHFPSSSLTLVDLAGSERAEAGGVLQETCAINSSLSALRGVVEALHRGGGYVPYRGSMLTRVMEGGLRGDGRMVVVVCVRGEEEWEGDTSRTLAFGEKLRRVERRGRVAGTREKGIRAGEEGGEGAGQLPVLVGNVIKRQRRA